MKKYLLLILPLLLFGACKKETTTGNIANNVTPNPYNIITYPDSVYYGKNILSYPDSILLTEQTDYELGAFLERNATLKLVFNNYPVVDPGSGHYTIWSYSFNIGWVVSGYNFSDNTQSFTESQTGRVSSEITFHAFSQAGHCKIDFYENGDSITRSKHIFWH